MPANGNDANQSPSFILQDSRATTSIVISEDSFKGFGVPGENLLDFLLGLRKFG